MACNLLHKLPKFYVKNEDVYETRTNKKIENNMKTFRIEGWYRLNDEKDFENLNVITDKAETAIDWFKQIYIQYTFYKIDVRELRLTEM